MINLNRIGGGLKLIKYIIANNQSKNAPWSKTNQVKQSSIMKNTRKPSK
jgi:hypothetical protein